MRGARVGAHRNLGEAQLCASAALGDGGDQGGNRPPRSQILQTAGREAPAPWRVGRRGRGSCVGTAG